MKEEWRKVITPRENLLLEHYEVSDRGRVRSLPRLVPRKACKRYPAHSYFKRGRVLRPGRRTSGHVTVVLGMEIGSVDVHALVARAFLGPTPSGKEIRHRDGRPANNRVANLHFGTHADNGRDRVFHGGRKVSVSMIRTVRERRAAGWSLRELAVLAGVSATHVCRIVKRRNYAHVV